MLSDEALYGASHFQLAGQREHEPPGLKPADLLHDLLGWFRKPGPQHIFTFRKDFKSGISLFSSLAPT